MTFGCGARDQPNPTIRDFLRGSGITNYWRLERSDPGLRLIPAEVGPGRQTQAELLLAWAYLPMDIDAGDGMTLEQLERELCGKLGMSIRLVPLGTDPARLELPVLSGRITGIPGRQLVGKLVGAGDWSVEYLTPKDSSFRGVRMSFTPRKEVITPHAFQ